MASVDAGSSAVGNGLAVSGFFGEVPGLKPRGYRGCGGLCFERRGTGEPCEILLISHIPEPANGFSLSCPRGRVVGATYFQRFGNIERAIISFMISLVPP